MVQCFGILAYALCRVALRCGGPRLWPGATKGEGQKGALTPIPRYGMLGLRGPSFFVCGGYAKQAAATMCQSWLPEPWHGAGHVP